MRGGLSAADFVKCISVQTIARKGFLRLADTVENSGRIRGLDGTPQCREGPSMRIHLPVRKAILIAAHTRHPPKGRSDKLRLDFNENTSGCSQAVRRALAKLTTKQLAMYPRVSVTTRGGSRVTFGVRPEELLLANGVMTPSRLLRHLRRAWQQHPDCEPTFPMYRYYAEIYGARISVLRYGSEMEFPLDGAIPALRKRPRLLFIANPIIRRGLCCKKKGCGNILKAATHTAVVMDEAYAEFSGFSAIPWIRKYPQLFVARTFSKVAGLAALRLGAVSRAKSRSPWSAVPCRPSL